MKVNDLVLNKYRIERLVSGAGTNRRGMSNLYKVVDINLGSFWAVKEIIKNSDGTISLEQSALIREAQIMRKLNHPSIPRIVSIDDLSDRVLIVMDWVDGRSVGEWLRSKGDLGVQRSLTIIKMVCNVLSYLHNRPTPILYRDMKPENIMYDPATKRVMLLDFGISEEVTPGKIIKDRGGTLGYADPMSLAPSKKSKANGAKDRYFDLRSDIYSLGWTMFHIFTGVSPYAYQTGKKDKGLKATRDIREFSKSLSPALAEIIIKATELDPKDRYQSIEEMIIALEDIDKVDKGLYSKLRFKINTVIALGAVGFLTAVGSIAPYMAYKSSLRYEYQTLVSNATKSGKVSDFEKVIVYDPKSIDPYFGLLDAIKSDGVFTKDEETTLLDLVNPNLPVIEKSGRYKEFAFEIGRLYWLYYEGDNGQETSSRWFKDSSGYSELADLYYSIGSFPSEIVKAANEGSDTGMYKKQFDSLNSVNGQSNLVNLQVAKAKVYLISTYPSRLKSDGVSYEDLLNSLKDSENLSKDLSSEDGRLGQLAKELGSELDQANKSLEEAYNV